MQRSRDLWESTLRRRGNGGSQIQVIGNSYEVKVELLREDTKFFEAFPYKKTIEVTEGAEAIDFFVQWLYTPGRFFRVPEIKTVLELWLFAEKIDTTVRMMSSWVPVDLEYVAGATKHDNDHDSVRQALLHSSDIIDLYLEYEAVYCLDTESDPRNRKKSPCRFHVHYTDKDREDCQLKLE
ncbi:uncharacterized protein EAF02_008476 [Botrytis sinoallii]|uniref:uncharacterized protein n=1 Tax=Botrytis sinoallii TaxID=1463999 RepID=UPI001900AE7E|nr:uncharacterized protein EAF02_008476 [Botrytis sinoallii]KAF7874499.1 hypothetical protein EAF02_008476 [Botrytis sinoallii]